MEGFACLVACMPVTSSALLMAIAARELRLVTGTATGDMHSVLGNSVCGLGMERSRHRVST